MVEAGHVVISTSVSLSHWKYAKEKGFRWADLIRQGIYANMKPDAITERMNALESELEAYKALSDANIKKRQDLFEKH